MGTGTVGGGRAHDLQVLTLCTVVTGEFIERAHFISNTLSSVHCLQSKHDYRSKLLRDTLFENLKPKYISVDRRLFFLNNPYEKVVN